MKNILICDDEKDIVEALKIYLNRPDYRLLSAYSGAEAVGIARRERLDLILMDIMMPGVDGLTALARIRAESDVPNGSISGENPPASSSCRFPTRFSSLPSSRSPCRRSSAGWNGSPSSTREEKP